LDKSEGSLGGSSIVYYYHTSLEFNS